MKKYIITCLLCLINIIVVFAQDSNKIINKTTRSTQSLGRIWNKEISFVKEKMDTFCIQVVNKVFTTVINTKFPYYDYEKDLLICDEEDYILDVLHLRISSILVDGDPYGYRGLVKKYIEPEVEYFSTYEEDSGGSDIIFTCYYNLEGNLLGMYTWMHDIRIPIAAIDKFEKEMKKRSVAIFNKTPSGEKYKRVPYVKMMLSYTFGKSK